MEPKSAYRLTGLVILVVGFLFFLRDLGINFIGDTSGWTIFIILAGFALLATGDSGIMKPLGKAMKKF